MKNSVHTNLYKLLKARPFCECAITYKNIYDAYCLRIIETLEMREKDEKKKSKKNS